MLSYYGLERHYPDVKDWYDGYRFGNADIYCPWDVINYCSDLLSDPTLAPQNYWLNTSGNDIVRHFIHKMGKGVTKAQLEQLVEGREVTKEIHQELTYTDLYTSVDNIWSILFTTGYLTKRSSEGNNIYQLAIPNMEIRDIFVKQILKLFKKMWERMALLYRPSAQPWRQEMSKMQNICFLPTLPRRSAYGIPS